MEIAEEANQERLESELSSELGEVNMRDLERQLRDNQPHHLSRDAGATRSFNYHQRRQGNENNENNLILWTYLSTSAHPGEERNTAGKASQYERE